MFSDKKICLQCMKDSSCDKEWHQCNFVHFCPFFEFDESKKDINIVVTVDDSWNLISTNENDIIKPKTQTEIELEKLKCENEKLRSQLSQTNKDFTDFMDFYFSTM